MAVTFVQIKIFWLIDSSIFFVHIWVLIPTSLNFVLTHSTRIISWDVFKGEYYSNFEWGLRSWSSLDFQNIFLLFTKIQGSTFPDFLHGQTISPHIYVVLGTTWQCMVRSMSFLGMCGLLWSRVSLAMCRQV